MARLSIITPRHGQEAGQAPPRLAKALGLAAGGLSLLAALAWVVYKLCAAPDLSLGRVPMGIGLVFLGAVQLLSLGIIGDYVRSAPVRLCVTEKERIGF